jgi:hypothetical protein
MLPSMRLVEQWHGIADGLPGGWGEARLKLLALDDGERRRAAQLLGPLNPAAAGNELLFSVGHGGGAPGAEAVRRALARLDEAGIDGRLQLLGVAEPQAAAQPEPPAATTLAAAWLARLDALPEDWSDVHAELELDSSDYVDRAALLTAPINPLRVPGRYAFTFRCARRFGYGAAPGMVRRCFERLDGDGITGDVRVLRVLSDTRPNATQGPVWYVGGRVH